ncbi:RluA family pseudouridine synthase [Phenylobacterium sp. LjRoot219]|uniref:RluA family pseudouridine synthase n=1 Tax=Phenylobacterium sp. LjRoot219 TaxID=3342283 RepID=UPI003ECD81F8
MTPRPPRKSRAPEKPPIKLTPEEIAFVRSLVIYEDESLLALNKPSGLSSQGGRGQVNTLDELLWAFAKPGKPRPRLIHRLDRDTSGVILTAKTKPAAGFLGKAMMSRKFAKTYRAIVAPGAPQPDAGVVEAALRREEIGREAYMRICAADHPDAESARTRYKTLKATDTAALLEVDPETGRMHQIRVHLSSLGRPIVGDVRYGGALMVEGQPAPRLMLHALALIFPHPGGGLKRLEAPTPPDMAALLAALKLD